MSETKKKSIIRHIFFIRDLLRAKAQSCSVLLTPALRQGLEAIALYGALAPIIVRWFDWVYEETSYDSTFTLILSFMIFLTASAMAGASYPHS